MALVVEDGSQKPNAESYVSAADACTYLNSRGNKTFAAANTEDQEAALRVATDYMLGWYRNKWLGSRAGTIQNLDWPRYAVPISDVQTGYGATAWYDNNVVPDPIKQACAELAVRSLSGDLAPDIERVAKSIRTGPVAIEFDVNSAPFTMYPVVANKLRPFLKGEGAATFLVRT